MDTTNLVVVIKKEVKWGHTATASADERRIYVFGGRWMGESSREVGVFDTASFSWGTLPIKYRTPDLARELHTAVLDNGQLYVFGGCYIGPTNTTTYLNDVQILDIEGKRWRKATTYGHIPEPRAGHTATLIKGEIYIFGGYCKNRAYNDLYILNLETLTWRRAPLLESSMQPPPRWLHAAAVLGQKLVIFGGIDGEMATTTAYYGDLWTYDSDKGKWERIEFGGRAETPFARRSHTLTPIGKEKFLLFGGYSFGNTFRNDLWRLHGPRTMPTATVHWNDEHAEQQQQHQKKKEAHTTIEEDNKLNEGAVVEVKTEEDTLKASPADNSSIVVEREALSSSSAEGPRTESEVMKFTTKPLDTPEQTSEEGQIELDVLKDYSLVITKDGKKKDKRIKFLLIENNLEKYWPAFLAQEVVLDDLEELRHEEWKELGVPIGPRTRIISALRKKKLLAQQKDTKAVELQEEVVMLKKQVEALVGEIQKLKEESKEWARMKSKMLQMEEEVVGLKAEITELNLLSAGKSPKSPNKTRIN